MTIKFSTLRNLAIALLCLTMASCSKDSDLKKADQTVQANIKMYTAVWEDIMNKGKIAEEQDFFDNLEFMQQLGLIPR